MNDPETAFCSTGFTIAVKDERPRRSANYREIFIGPAAIAGARLVA